MTSFLDALTERGVDAKFAPGFTLDLEPADPALEAEAVEAAKGADVVLMLPGFEDALGVLGPWCHGDDGAVGEYDHNVLVFGCDGFEQCDLLER